MWFMVLPMQQHDCKIAYNGWHFVIHLTFFLFLEIKCMQVMRFLTQQNMKRWPGNLSRLSVGLSGFDSDNWNCCSYFRFPFLFNTFFFFFDVCCWRRHILLILWTVCTLMHTLCASRVTAAIINNLYKMFDGHLGYVVFFLHFFFVRYLNILIASSYERLERWIG